RSEATADGDSKAVDGVQDEMTADGSMVAAAVGGSADGEAGQQTGRRSAGQRLSDFEDSGRRDENLDRATDTIGAAATAVGTGAVRTGRKGRLAAGRARAIPENLRRNIAGGAAMAKRKWDAGKPTRERLRKDPQLAADYLATRGAGKAAKVVGTVGTKLAAAAKDPATYRKALKGAALYGGLGLASGGLAVPAAVMGGRALIKHRKTVASGAAGAATTGAGALTGLAKSSYRAGVPE